MPYIIVRSRMDPTAELAFHKSKTYIEYYAEDGEQSDSNILETAMSNVGAERHLVYNMVDNVKTISPWRSYQTTQPPYLVLNILESQAGYKVVAANSASHHTGFHFQVWTLHKQVQSPKQSNTNQ